MSSAQTALDACKTLPVAEFSASDHLLTQDAVGSRLFVLIDGEVAVRKGQVEIARISEPGAIFGEISSLLGIPYSASVVALGPTRAHVSEDGASFIASSPEIALHTSRVLAKRLYDATTYLADLKLQFQDHANHFGMMDQILEALLQQQGAPADRAIKRDDDPRL